MTSNPMIPQSHDDAIALLGEIRATTNRFKKLKLDYDQRKKALDDKFDTDLQKLKQEIEAQTQLLAGWSKAHPEAFQGAKSIKCLHGTFGYRTCPPRLEPKFPLTMEKVLHNLKTLAGGEKFIRVEETVDCETIIAMRGEIGEDNLRKIGVKIVQDETFFAKTMTTDTLV